MDPAEITVITATREVTDVKGQAIAVMRGITDVRTSYSRDERNNGRENRYSRDERNNGREERYSRDERNNGREGPLQP